MAAVKRSKSARLASKQPIWWNIVMFDPTDDDSTEHVVKKNLSDEQAWKWMTRLESRNTRMVYGAHSVRHRG